MFINIDRNVFGSSNVQVYESYKIEFRLNVKSNLYSRISKDAEVNMLKKIKLKEKKNVA